MPQNQKSFTLEMGKSYLSRREKLKLEAEIY